MVAVDVFRPLNNPSVRTNPLAFKARFCATRPNVLDDVLSDALEALETTIFVPSAPLTYTACPFVNATPAFTSCFN